MSQIKKTLSIVGNLTDFLRVFWRILLGYIFLLSITSFLDPIKRIFLDFDWYSVIAIIIGLIVCFVLGSAVRSVIYSISGSIQWHKFSVKKPYQNGNYIVSIDWKDEIEICSYKHGVWENIDNCFDRAWADLPKAFIPGETDKFTIFDMDKE